MAKNTLVEYLYRDGSNYKIRGSFVVRGRVTRDQIKRHLYMDELFLPELVGVPSLTPEPRDEDDHDFHEIERMTETDAQACITATQFIVGLRRGAHGLRPGLKAFDRAVNGHW